MNKVGCKPAVKALDYLFVIGVGVCRVIDSEADNGDMTVAGETVRLKGVKVQSLESRLFITIGHPHVPVRTAPLTDPSLLDEIRAVLSSNPQKIQQGPHWHLARRVLESDLAGKAQADAHIAKQQKCDPTAAVTAVARVVRDLHRRVAQDSEAPGEHWKLYESASLRLRYIVAVVASVPVDMVTIAPGEDQRPKLTIKQSEVS